MINDRICGGARTSRQPGHFQVTKVVRQVIRCSAVKEPCHFEVRKSSSQVTGCTFSSEKLTTFLFFSRCPQNTGRQRRWLFHCQNKTNKAVRYGNIFSFCSHYCRIKANLPARLFDLARPGVAPPLHITNMWQTDRQTDRQNISVIAVPCFVEIRAVKKNNKNINWELLSMLSLNVRLVAVRIQW